MTTKPHLSHQESNKIYRSFRKYLKRDSTENLSQPRKHKHKLLSKKLLLSNPSQILRYGNITLQVRLTNVKEEQVICNDVDF
jgi:formylmethanofuran dehydrogenase subunit E